MIHKEVDEHTPCDYSVNTICAFDDKENKNDKYRGDDCKEEICKNLKKACDRSNQPKEKLHLNNQNKSSIKIH